MRATTTSQPTRWTCAAAVVGLLLSARPIGAVPPIDLRGNNFSGTYVQTGTTSNRSLQIEIEKQHRRRLRISVFAMDLPEFRGPGKLSKDNTTVTANGRATGRGKVPHFLITATVGGGGASLSGGYTIRLKGRPDVTGTFSVAR